jgi:spore germination cell wall hydrolase CwlJ-like protein
VCTARAQFSCWWDGQAAKVRTVDENDPRFDECLEIARLVIEGEVADPTQGADHYYATSIPPPKWARGRTPVVKIGAHVFYKIGRSG